MEDAVAAPLPQVPDSAPRPVAGSPLVVIGSSAGGIEALSTLLGTLPTSFPAPIVLAQHLDPSRPSHLAEVLRSKTKLPIVLVESSAKLQPGTIYVVPANRHLEINDGHVEAVDESPERPRPSIDILLSSAARVYRDRLFAVILTGRGSDGAAGAVDVNAAGGTVIIQNPETARYPAMPMALPPTVVDHVVDLESVAPLLRDLLQGTTLTEEVEDGEKAGLEAILSLVSRSTNVDFLSYKPTTILRRVTRRMAAVHLGTLVEYARHLAAHPEEVAELVMSFLIKVTEFFRDAEAFQHIREKILPMLIARARDRDRTLRFWSAGCATGEEPYSVALLVADLLGDELRDWNVKIFATDLDDSAIAFARRGLYPANVLQGLPDGYRDRFFETTEHGVQIAKSLRQMVIFGQQDLGRGAPFPRIDLVLCRNLLIYFKPVLQHHVLDLFAYSLHHAGGYLFLGKAETARPTTSNFELIDKRWKVYQCTGSPLRSLVSGRELTAREQRVTRRIATPGFNVEPTEGEPSPGDAAAQLRRFNDLVLRHVTSGAVIIDRLYRLVTVNAAGRRLLGLHDVGHDTDFLHAARGLPYNQVRTAIDAVFRERSPLTISDVELDRGSEARFLSFTISLLQLDGATGELVLVSVSDVSDAVQTRRRLESVQTEQGALVSELSAANKRLGDMNKDLQDANEELQASNEEMMLTQEELQATNEELEATNEELQATNEELETNNEEVQATNEELEATNDELAARSSELRELTTTVTGERVRLGEMIELAPFFVMMLRGPALTIEACNPRFSQVLHSAPATGRTVDEVFRAPELASLVPLTRDTFWHDKISESPRIRVPLTDKNSGFWTFKMIPTHDAAGKVDGVVVYGEDVTAAVAFDTAQGIDRLKMMINHADQVDLGLYDAKTMRLLQGSPRYLEELEEVHGISPVESIGRTWAELTFMSPPTEAIEIFRRVAGGSHSHRTSEVRRRVDAHERVWDCTLIPVPLSEGAVQTHVLFSAIEVTDTVRARDELARVNDMRDEFLSLASHELRTPMVTLMAYADRLEASVAGSDRTARAAELSGNFAKQLQHMRRLIDDLSDVARLQGGNLRLELQPLELAPLVEHGVAAVRVTYPDAVIQLDVSDDVRSAWVEADAERLLQVVSNLLDNAISHNAEGSPITVRLRIDNRRASLQVVDRGEGVDSAVLAKLFDRFYRAPRGARPARAGLGLGLYICKQIVEQLGGTIGVRSKVGEGSIFEVHLPLLRG